MHIIFHPIRCDHLAPLEAHVLDSRLIVCGMPVEGDTGDALPDHPYVVSTGKDRIELLLPYGTVTAPDVRPVTVQGDGPVLLEAK